MRISFIGGGVMAESLFGGILKSGLASHNEVKVGEPIEHRRSHLESAYGLKTEASNLDVIEGIDILVLSIKPQNLMDAASELHGQLGPDVTVLSILAGISIDSLVDKLGHKAVIRVMPNTPSQVGMGMSVWTASSSVQNKHKTTARDMLQTFGEEVYVSDEKFIDMATALSASGPAYVFLFIEAMIDAGVYLGMPREMARKLVLQTVSGSTKLAEQSGLHPAELKDIVTSPGGTTIEALLALEKRNFRASIAEAVIAAFEKSKSLGDDN